MVRLWVVTVFKYHYPLSPNWNPLPFFCWYHKICFVRLHFQTFVSTLWMDALKGSMHGKTTQTWNNNCQVTLIKTGLGHTINVYTKQNCWKCYLLYNPLLKSYFFILKGFLQEQTWFLGLRDLLSITLSKFQVTFAFFNFGTPCNMINVHGNFVN